MSTQPADLKLLGPSELQITWTDGEVRLYRVRELRDACPCASCIEKRTNPPVDNLLPVLSAAEMQPLRITSMKPAGNYAYAIDFSDGHNTGIYTLELLKTLGRVAASDA